MDHPTPAFPALIVYDDSVGLLSSLVHWTGDVDQWFWSDPTAYIIDSLGRRFDQRCERTNDGRPVDIPVWAYTSQVDEDFVVSLVERELRIRIEDWGDIKGLGAKLSFMIERMIDSEGQ